eukprot:160462-Rhodomonas_salina.1
MASVRSSGSMSSLYTPRSRSIVASAARVHACESVESQSVKSTIRELELALRRAKDKLGSSHAVGASERNEGRHSDDVKHNLSALLGPSRWRSRLAVKNRQQHFISLSAGPRGGRAGAEGKQGAAGAAAAAARVALPGPRERTPRGRA